jgi:hypothetical protein
LRKRLCRAVNDPIVNNILHRSTKVVDYASWSLDSFSISFVINIYSEQPVREVVKLLQKIYDTQVMYTNNIIIETSVPCISCTPIKAL